MTEKLMRIADDADMIVNGYYLDMYKRWAEKSNTGFMRIKGLSTEPKRSS